MLTTLISHRLTLSGPKFFLEFRETYVSPGKTEVKQCKFVEFICPAKEYFRETYKSQKINPISQTPKFTFGIIQIGAKSLSTSFQWLVKKLICTISISDFNLTQRSGMYVRSNCLHLC